MPIPKKEDLSAKYLRSLVEYDSETGIMKWKVKKFWRVNIGDEVGRLRPDGYRHVKIDSKMYLTHRLAWLYVHGIWPDFVDHINLVRCDNRIENLRNCTQSENGANRAAQTNSSSATKGIYLADWGGGNFKWKAQIYQTVNGKKHALYLGGYETAEEAKSVYDAKAKELYGEFARS